MKDSKLDHKTIVAQLEATLRGLRRGMDATWDMGNNDVDNMDKDAEIIGSKSSVHSETENRIHPPSRLFSIDSIRYHFMWRIPAVFLVILGLCALVEWIVRHRPPPPTTTRGRSSPKTWKSWLWTFGMISVIATTAVYMTCLYSVRHTTLPIHTLRMI